MTRAGICNAREHAFSRRSLLGGVLGAAGAAVTPGWLQPALAGELSKRGKRLLIIWHGGGLSQLESWDLKLGAETGGPCLPIATSVPGIQISEWLPHTARQMHHLFLLRGLSTGENNHGPGYYLMTTGRREGAALVYPHLACVANNYLTPDGHSVPGYVSIGAAGSPAFLGPRLGPVSLVGDKPPANLQLPAALTAEADQRRQNFRRLLDRGFARGRGAAEATAYTGSFDQAAQLMNNKRLFDMSYADPRQLDRYGTHEFGKRCLLALRLLEQGVTCVTVSHDGYDTHAENFNVHFDLLEQFDRPFACLVEDMAAQGMLEDTLLVVMGEFGRTPQVNHRMGRDHFSGAWSCVLGGVGFPRGAVYGKTNETCYEVVEGKVEAAPLFHTLLKALGIDSKQHWTVDGEQVPIADPAAAPIDAILS